MAKQLTWRKAIEKVLSEASGAMHYKDLTDKIIEAGMRTELGATPAATVSAHLTTAIKNEGPECPWQKIGRGLYVWKAKAGISPDAPAVVPVEEEETEEEQYAVVSSFGMFLAAGRNRVERKPENSWDAADRRRSRGFLQTDWHLPPLRWKRGNLCRACDRTPVRKTTLRAYI